MDSWNLIAGVAMHADAPPRARGSGGVLHHVPERRSQIILAFAVLIIYAVGTTLALQRMLASGDGDARAEAAAVAPVLPAIPDWMPTFAD